MSELVDWINARLDEDEATARAAADEGAAPDVARLPSATFAHVVAWGPARVLAEVNAKRAIVAMMTDEVEYVVYSDDVLRLLASVWVDAPGFREEWRP